MTVSPTTAHQNSSAPVDGKRQDYPSPDSSNGYSFGVAVDQAPAAKIDTQSVTWLQQLDAARKPTTGDLFDTRELFRQSKRYKNIQLRRALVLFSSDLASLVFSWFVAVTATSFIRQYVGTSPELSLVPKSIALQFVIFVLPVVLILWKSILANSYKVFKPLIYEALDYLKIIFVAAAATTVVLFAMDGHFSRILFFSFWLTVVFVLPLSRHLIKHLLMKADCWYRPTAIFGTGKNAKQVSDAIGVNRWLGMKVVAFIDTDENNNAGMVVERGKVISSIRDPRFYELKFGNPHYIFAPETQEEYEACQSTLNHINSIGDCVTLSPPFYGLPLAGAEILNLPRSESMFLSIHNNLKSVPNLHIKRLFDLCMSGALMLILAPVILLLALIIKIDGGSIFYRQERIGRDNKLFSCYKFRSMVVNGDEVLARHLSENPEAKAEWEATHKLKNDPRVTKVGKFIRKYSLDELPQLFNVFLNQMSLVGPRPIVFDEKERYGDKLPYYLNTNPGITGLWQTSGRSNTSYQERVQLDVWYAKNWSFWLDIVILAKTIPSIVGSKGAY